ncbi:MAG: CBS domain-containing protein [Archangium sp.]|nr:CBS domain-containing protein [Archangium sp.]
MTIERKLHERRRAAEAAPALGLLTVVLALDSELSAAEALAVLDASNVTSAPVVDDNQVLVGVVSASQLALLRDDPEAEVEDAMSTHVVAATDEASIADVLQLLARQELDRLPIVTTGGTLRGVVTAMDVVRWFAGEADRQRSS